VSFCSFPPVRGSCVQSFAWRPMRTAMTALVPHQKSEMDVHTVEKAHVSTCMGVSLLWGQTGGPLVHHPIIVCSPVSTASTSNPTANQQFEPWLPQADVRTAKFPEKASRCGRARGESKRVRPQSKKHPSSIEQSPKFRDSIISQTPAHFLTRPSSSLRNTQLVILRTIVIS
jgi:hypothetical protein